MIQDAPCIITNSAAGIAEPWQALTIDDVPIEDIIAENAFPSCEPIGCNPDDLPYDSMTEKCRYGLKDVSFFEYLNA